MDVQSIKSELLKLIGKRRSIRAFSGEAVQKESLQRIFEAARWAPSAYNEQPWRFIVVEKLGNPTFNKVVHALMPGNQGWASGAPLLLVATAKKSFSRDGRENNWARYDLGQAVAQMVLQATAEGLFAHQMAGFYPDKMRQALNIPEEFEPVTVIALGHRGSPSVLPDELRKLENGPRNRLPLSQLVFQNEWEQPAEIPGVLESEAEWHS